MSVVVVSEARVRVIDPVHIAAVREHALEVFQGVPGFRGMSVYEGTTDPSVFLALNEYDSDESFSDGWNAFARSPVLEEFEAAVAQTPDLHRYEIEFRQGTTLTDVPVGTFLSHSRRIADPGHGSDVVRELHGIFTELQAIVGYVGGLGGRRVDLPEEVLGLAYWASRADFELSLPRKPLYEINLYQRVL